MPDDNYQLFCKRIHQLIGLDLALYKDKQMKRRIGTYMTRLGVSNYLELANLLSKDEEALNSFKEFLTINVSEFFRNPEQFEILKTKIMPEIIRPNSRFRVWSAGCSDGCEPYTLVIILEELGIKNYEILATDFDVGILARAKTGAYKIDSLRNVSPILLNKYFLKGEGDIYQFNPKLAMQVKFLHHDLLSGKYEKNLDLILCRNVVIYFTEEAKNQVFMKMSQALRQDGVLFVGGTESILAPKKFGFQTIYPFFYKKVSNLEATML